MSLRFDVYWSFRSPYSYLATPRLHAFARAYDVEVNIRIVRPLAVRTPDHFERMDPLWRPYLFIDTKRMADFLGIPFRRPVPDPIVQDPVTNEIAAEQPYIRDLAHLGIAAVEAGRGLDYIHEVSSMLWGGVIDGWDTGDHLAQAAARAGLDHTDLRARIAADPAAYDHALEANEADLRSVGHWGVPTFVFQGEPFFGQDRFDVLVWRMKQAGMAPREGASDGN